MSRQRKYDSSVDGPRRSISGRDGSRSNRVYSAPIGGGDRDPKLDYPVVLTPWEAFQEHLRLIDDNSAMYTFRESVSDRDKERDGKDKDSKDKDGKKENSEAGDENKTTEQKALEMAQQLSVAIKVKNSEVFNKTMHEFQLRRQQHLERLAAVQRERERRAREQQHQADVLTDDLLATDWSDADDTDTVDKKAVAIRQAATRGWTKIRRYIEEKAMERKQKSSAMNWTFLHQTMSHMTDLERGRQNLYERYLVNPDSWKDGFTNFPNELFDKERVRERRMYGSQPNLKRTNNSRYKKTKSLRSESSIKTH